MKKTGLLIVCFFTLLPLAAQKSPVGIVSVQDSVKGFQFGVFSSVAADGAGAAVLAAGTRECRLPDNRKDRGLCLGGLGIDTIVRLLNKPNKYP